MPRYKVAGLVQRDATPFFVRKVNKNSMRKRRHTFNFELSELFFYFLFDTWPLLIYIRFSSPTSFVHTRALQQLLCKKRKEKKRKIRKGDSTLVIFGLRKIFWANMSFQYLYLLRRKSLAPRRVFFFVDDLSPPLCPVFLRSILCIFCFL